LRRTNSARIVPPRSMNTQSDSMAWLTRGDGSRIIGRGPFTAAAQAPATGTAFYVQDFALSDPKPWKIPHEAECLASESMADAKSSEPIECEWQALDATPFSAVFQEIMTSIHSGGFEKTVPVVTETGVCKSAPIHAIASAMQCQRAPLHSYGWIDGDSGFAGATPELLFSLDDHHLETMALAGTARSEDHDVFAADEKEIREHEYVAQTLVSKLLDLGQLSRHPRSILNLGSIVHFLTRISVKLHSPMPPEALIRKLHPTPALGPLPRTTETMNQLIGWRQRLDCPAQFGAPFGVLHNGRFEAIVAIRGIWCDGPHIRIPAGCGIIEASRLVNEWRELRLKRESVKNFLSR
jgi:menaquinone-specific isochorismate synthase